MKYPMCMFCELVHACIYIYMYIPQGLETTNAHGNYESLEHLQFFQEKRGSPLLMCFKMLPFSLQILLSIMKSLSVELHDVFLKEESEKVDG